MCVWSQTFISLCLCCRPGRVLSTDKCFKTAHMLGGMMEAVFWQKRKRENNALGVAWYTVGVVWTSPSRGPSRLVGPARVVVVARLECQMDTPPRPMFTASSCKLWPLASPSRFIAGDSPSLPAKSPFTSCKLFLHFLPPFLFPFST